MVCIYFYHFILPDLLITKSTAVLRTIMVFQKIYLVRVGVYS